MKHRSLSHFIAHIKVHNVLVSVAVIAVCAVILSLLWINRNTHVTVATSNKSINLSPTVVQSIEQIGEWEFLAIHDEELVDTSYSSLFSEKHLIRIYKGTLRLGIDLREAKAGWLTTRGDTVIVKLPAIKLLDENFIDEAQTQSVFEKGDWDNNARQALFNKAHKMMKQRCLTKQNIKIAEENAREQFRHLPLLTEPRMAQNKQVVIEFK